LTGLDEFLGGEHDLRYRARPGDVHYYRRTSTYNQLDDLGVPVVRNRIRGDLRRVVDSVDPDGVPHETLTWRNVTVSQAKGDEPFGNADHLPWADGFTYSYCIEDDYTSFDTTVFDALPRTLEGWFFVLLVRDTQGPIDNMRSARMEVDELKHIGDEVTRTRDPAEAASQHSTLSFPPIIDCPYFAVSVLHSRFDAISVVGDQPCAILGFSMEPCIFETIFMDNQMLGGSSFAGTMTLRLSDGSHESAHFEEYVFFEGGVNHKPIYDMWRITEEEYERAPS
jgi:hypothetical protein